MPSNRSPHLPNFVDIRRDSPTFGKWVSAELSEANRSQLWIPPGFAHGFLSLDESNEVLYKATDFYAVELERSLRWDDSSVGIQWPSSEVTLSAKDRGAGELQEV